MSEESTRGANVAGEAAQATGEAIEAIGTEVAGLIGGETQSEHTAEDVERYSAAGEQIGGSVAHGAEAWRQSESAARAAQRGDGWGAAGGAFGAGAAAGGQLAGSLDAVATITGDGGFADAARVARAVGAGANFVASAVRQAGAFVRAAEEAAAEHTRRVEYRLAIDHEEVGWRVRHVTATEELGQPYELVVDIEHDDVDEEAGALLGKDATLAIERRGHQRCIAGIVRRVIEAHGRRHHAHATIHVVPALWLLGQGSDSRIFQQKSAVEILEAVLSTALQPYGREVDAGGLTATYATREFCVQYRESDLAFAHRLMEEEGIGYVFDVGDDGVERVVLFDRNEDAPEVETLDDNAVPYADGAVLVRQAEPIFAFSAARQLTPTAIVVRDLDWTQNDPRVEATRNGRDDQGRTRPLYHHDFARNVTLWDYQGAGRYGRNDVEQQARIRHELARRDAQTFEGESFVTGLRAGCRFTLSGHPSGCDGEYLVTRVSHRSDPPEGVEGNGADSYHNRFTCMPVATPYRPERRARKPRIYGTQTAVVTGPNEGEIHTDEHGRIQVQFHWDREAMPPATSCWMRVAQTWAGHDSLGYPGFVFIPRVGMEVLVTFVDGDPDRPLVTGAVYNGRNLPPEALPAEASRSMIRTRSLGGTGYNELSFEDASGREEVHLRAERNLRELVQHDHATHVQRHQRNTVDANQTELVGGDQSLTVRGNREHTVEKDENITVQQNRSESITLDDTQTVGGSRATIVQTNETHDVFGNRAVHVMGSQEHTVDAGAALHVTAGGLRETVSGGVVQVVTDGGVQSDIVGDQVHAVRGNLNTSVAGNYRCIADELNQIHGRETLLSAARSVTVVAPQGLSIVATGNNTEQRDNWTVLYDSLMSHCKGASISVGLMKADLWAFKVDLWGAKYSTNKGLEFEQNLVSITKSTGARISDAVLHLFR